MAFCSAGTAGSTCLRGPCRGTPHPATLRLATPHHAPPRQARCALCALRLTSSARKETGLQRMHRAPQGRHAKTLSPAEPGYTATLTPLRCAALQTRFEAAPAPQPRLGPLNPFATVGAWALAAGPAGAAGHPGQPGQPPAAPLRAVGRCGAMRGSRRGRGAASCGHWDLVEGRVRLVASHGCAAFPVLPNIPHSRASVVPSTSAELADVRCPGLRLHCSLQGMHG